MRCFGFHQADVRKKEEKEAAEALKREEELREARRQQQRLNFLLTQTELYSHFMQNKTAGTGSSQPNLASDSQGNQ
jgi:DNA helicase INO80